LQQQAKQFNSVHGNKVLQKFGFTGMRVGQSPKTIIWPSTIIVPYRVALDLMVSM